MVRVDNDGRGFLFINNYQDHAELHDQKDFAVSIRTRRGDIRIPSTGSMNLEKGAYAILPFYFNADGVTLEYATLQLVTECEYEGRNAYLFTAVSGMEPTAVFEKGTVVECISGCHLDGEETIVFDETTGGIALVNGKCFVVVLSVKDSMRLWQIDTGNGRMLFLSDYPVLYKDNSFFLEYRSGQNAEIGIASCGGSAINVNGVRLERTGTNGIFSMYRSYRGEESPAVDFIDKSSKNDDNDDGGLKRPVVGSPITSSKVVNARGIFHFKASDFEGAKQLMLKIDYTGDIGYAFINGKMIHDNFCNGRTWEIDLMPYKDEILAHGLYVYVSPHKEGSYIDSSSAMAAMVEVAGKQTAEILSVSAERVEDITLDF